MENLFVYGSLLSYFKNPLAIKIQEEGEFLGKAIVRGKLFDAGSYPVALPSKNFYIIGEIYKIPEVLFFDLDDYEDYNQIYPEESLFKRKLTKAYLLEDKSKFSENPEYNLELIKNLKVKFNLPCWIYWYNKQINGYTFIKKGNYVEYIQTKRELYD